MPYTTESLINMMHILHEKYVHAGIAISIYLFILFKALVYCIHSRRDVKIHQNTQQLYKWCRMRITLSFSIVPILAIVSTWIIAVAWPSLHAKFRFTPWFFRSYHVFICFHAQYISY